VEVAGISLVIALAGGALAASWGRWVHPAMDSGRELHIAWRLSEGAVLYRDVENVYGPLSQYFNATLFRVFGVGLNVLVASNLVIAAAILALAYVSFRRAWGVIGAIGATAVFSSLFAFSQFIGPPVFTYAFPYSHEATHGILISLALAYALGRWLEVRAARWSTAAGICAGLTFVLKPEFIVSSIALSVTAATLHRLAGKRFSGREIAFFSIGATAPVLLFTAYFSRFLPWGDAFLAANRAWSSILVYPELPSKPYQLTFSGFDHPWRNLIDHLSRTGIALVLLGSMGGLLAAVLKLRSRSWRFAGIALVAALTAIAGLRLEWGFAGRCLLGLMLLMLLLWYWRFRRGLHSGREVWQLLLLVLAIALMARMALNGRIVQFGFFQAAPAAMVVAAFVVSGAVDTFPRMLRRGPVAVVGLTLLATACGWAFRQNAFYRRIQTHEVGQGADRFVFYAPSIEPTGELLDQVVVELRKLPPEATVLALPEGSMVNYLARRRSPLPHFQYYSFTTEDGREARIVEALRGNPPDAVVILSRSLGDFGIRKYGETNGSGAQILGWIRAHYSLTHHFGGDPLDGENQRGAYILKHNSKLTR
jgi:hypothetical protein